MKMTDEEFAKVFAEVQASNPGTECWEGGHPRTGDRWIYRPATPQETNIYEKIQREQREKAELGNPNVAYDMLIAACVLYPPRETTDPATPTLPKLLAMRPMLRSRMAAEVCDVTGLCNDIIQKKLSPA